MMLSMVLKARGTAQDRSQVGMICDIRSGGVTDFLGNVRYCWSQRIMIVKRISFTCVFNVAIFII